MSVRPVTDEKKIEELEGKRRRRITWSLRDLEAGKWYETDISPVTIYAKARKEGVKVTVKRDKEKRVTYFKITKIK